MTTATLAIGAIADQTGATVGAVRHYEDLGLLPVADRVGGKRRFEPSIVGRVNFIRRAQDVGLSLTEIKEILDDQDGDWRRIVGEKLTDLHDQRRRLDTMIDLLSEMGRCGCQAVTSCPAYAGT